MDLLFPLLIVFMIGMIFFSNRQRKKQAQKQESLQNSISVGDVVVMTSGISGTVVDTDDEKTIDLEIAPDVITTWLRAAVREKLAGDADTLTTEHISDAPHAGDVEHHEVIDAAPEHDAPTHSTSPATGSTSPGSRNGSTDAGFSDPTATPNGNGVSAGTSTPGEPRSSN